LCLQCSLPNVSFATKWLFSMGLPLAACAIFFLLHMNLYIKKRFLLGRTTKTMTHVDVLVGAWVVLCRLQVDGP
jgi:arginine exporter protein ArgO